GGFAARARPPRAGLRGAARRWARRGRGGPRTGRRSGGRPSGSAGRSATRASVCGELGRGVDVRELPGIDLDDRRVKVAERVAALGELALERRKDATRVGAG